jgi:hypothetical protein
MTWDTVTWWELVDLRLHDNPAMPRAPEETMTDDSERPRTPLLTPRAALLFLISILVAVGAGVLTMQAGHNVAEAVLVSGAAFAAAAKFTDWLIS